MHKVLLVDDENLVIKSLEAGVDWKKSGFSVVGKANNGVKALQLVKTLRPHIVFTDIRMPGISGLELIKKIKEMDDKIQIIVISGYAEFAYVQKSLHYGVLGYCLKPFDDYEIDQLLKTAAKIIDELKQKREDHLLDLLEEMPSELAQASFDQLLAEEGFTADPLYVLVSLGKERLCFGDEVKTITIPIGGSKNGYLIQCQSQDALLQSIVGEIPEGILGVGLVKTDRQMNSMLRSLDKATVLAWDFFIHGRREFFCEYEIIDEEKANQRLRQLDKAIVKKDISLIRGLLEEMLIPENKQGLSTLHALKIYNIVYFHASSDPASLPQEDYIFSKDQLYHLFHDFDSMINSLKESLCEEEQQNEVQVEDKTGNNSLKEIIKYMNEHYRSDISIQSISKSFYLNPNYLSQLFKRELNFTFTEYLTKIRMQEAKNLLQTTGLSISEIAERIGFRDYFYFIRTFKKHTAQTPRQFRNRDISGPGKSRTRSFMEEGL